MSMLGEQIKELRRKAGRLDRASVFLVDCEVLLPEGWPKNAMDEASDAMREAADTIESLRDRLQEEGDALRDYRASQIAAEAERRLLESYGQVPELGKCENEDEHESYATQECHATQPNYEHCKYSTNRGWRDTSRYSELFGTPERTARTLEDACFYCDGKLACDDCVVGKMRGFRDTEDEVEEWLRGDA